jgi:hypothetical protein
MILALRARLYVIAAPAPSYSAHLLAGPTDDRMDFVEWASLEPVDIFIVLDLIQQKIA